jgi:hypothetical protein
MSIYGRAFIAVLLVVIFEGAIRKWVFESAGIPLLALRDFIVLFFIFIGVKKKYLNFQNPLELTLLVWSLIVFIWSVSHFMLGFIPLPVIILTLHFWILYMWFAILMYRTLTLYDIKIILRVLIFSIIPMSILAVIQFFAPVESFINKQVGSIDGEGVFLLAAGIVRATGTFSFTMGYTTYLALISPFIFWIMSDGSNIIKNTIVKILTVLLFFLGVIVSGSRGAIFFTLAMFVFYLFSFLIGNGFHKIKVKTILIVSVMLSISIYVAYPFLEIAYDANTARIDSASKSENVSKRIFDTFVGKKETWDNFSLLGKGIGGGSSAARAFMPTSGKEFIMGEMEIDRILTEAGIVGLLFELIKLFLVIVGLSKSFFILIKKKFTLPFLFWVYLSIQLLTTSTTGQITVHAFVMLSLALGLLLIRPNIYKNLQINSLNKDRKNYA